MQHEACILVSIINFPPTHGKQRCQAHIDETDKILEIKLFTNDNFSVIIIVKQ